MSAETDAGEICYFEMPLAFMIFIPEACLRQSLFGRIYNGDFDYR